MSKYQKSPMRRISLNGYDGKISVCYWAGPEGAPVLHWAHANGFNGQTYAPLLAKLSERFHVYAADARGHGKSTLVADPEHHFGWDIYRDDLVSLLYQLRARHANAPLVLGGHSMGGCVSIMAAAKEPRLAQGMVVVDPVIIPHGFKLLMALGRLFNLNIGGGHKLAAMSRKRRFVWPDAKTLTAAYKGRGAFTSWKQAFLTAYVKGGTLKTDDGIRLACVPDWEAANFAYQGHDSITPVKKLAIPFRLLTAEHGSTTRGIKAFKKNHHAQSIEVVPNSTHFLPMEVPDRVIEEFNILADRLDLA